MFFSTVMVMAEFFKTATPKYTINTNILSNLNPFKWLEEKTYGQLLEEYILKHKPIDTCHIEHLEKQFDRLYAKSYSLKH